MQVVQEYCSTFKGQKKIKFTTGRKLELENMNEEVLNTEILAMYMY